MGSLSMMTTLLGCFDLHSRVVYIFEKIPFHYGDTCPKEKRQPNGFRAKSKAKGHRANDPRGNHEPDCDYQGNRKPSHCPPVLRPSWEQKKPLPTPCAW
jgi:hypothetical protein